MGQSLSATTAVVDRQGATSVCTTPCLSVAGQTNVQGRVSGWLAVEVKREVRDAAGVQRGAQANPANRALLTVSLLKNPQQHMNLLLSVIPIRHPLPTSRQSQLTTTLRLSRAMAGRIPQGVSAMILWIVLVYLNLPTVGNPLCVNSLFIRTLVGYSILVHLGLCIFRSSCQHQHSVRP